MKVKQWEGKTVVCIASGPSLTPNDCNLVKQSGLPTIAVNTSIKMADFAEVLYAGDLSWWDNNLWAEQLTVQKWTCSERAARKYNINYHEAHGPYNSGLRAVQFAIDNGAYRVIMLGFDCSIKNGSHWHGDHESGKNPTNSSTRQWARQFFRVTGQAKLAGTILINCSRYTELEGIDKGDLEQELISAKTENEIRNLK